MEYERIEIKSFGTLIDDLITTSQKIWHLQDKMVLAEKVEDRAEAAKQIQILNLRRNHLINAIDRRMGEEDITTTKKTYQDYL